MAEPAIAPDGEALPDEIALRLKWRKSWDDKENDFVARDEKGNQLARIYIHPGGINSGRWRWFVGGSSGFADSPREAARDAEECYFRSRPS